MGTYDTIGGYPISPDIDDEFPVDECANYSETHGITDDMPEFGNCEKCSLQNNCPFYQKIREEEKINLDRF